MTRIVSAGFEVAFPTGSAVRGLGRGTTMFEPYLAAGTMLGGLYVQRQGKLELPADAEEGRSRLRLQPVRRGRYLVYAEYVDARRLNGESDELALTPQVRKGLTRTGALAAFGVHIPLNERSNRPTRAVGCLLWEYLEPVRAWR